MKAIITVELYLDFKNRDDYNIEVEVKEVIKAIKKELAFTYNDDAFMVYTDHVITEK